MVEKIVSALRKSFLLVFFRNFWLFWAALAYSFLSLVLILGATALPVVYWVLTGGHFDPALLFSRPLEFIVSHRLLIIYALAGYTVGFILFLLVWLFFHAALTAVVTRAVEGLRDGGTGRVEPGEFLRGGRRLMAGSTGTAALAGLLPLPAFVVLLAVAVVLLIRLAVDPGLLVPPFSGGLVLLAAAGVLSLLATVLLTVLAVLWYRYALCAVCADSLGVARAMRASLRFFFRCWHGVLGLVLASILIGLALSGLTLPVSYGIKLLGDFSRILEIMLVLPGGLLSVAVGVGSELWVKSALVAFYLDTRQPQDLPPA
ncbi:MAG: hypothetical protein JXQ83_06335 [Candidatus Glassbacteria bacterium]|nr:hypothetical protein [Candidatus Glassbacteria bacterium]